MVRSGPPAPASHDPPDAAAARAFRRVGFGVLLYVAAYLLIVQTALLPAATRDVVANLFSSVGPIAAGLLILARTRRSSMGDERRGWRLVAVAVLVWGLGSLTYTVIEHVLGADPFPSVADLGFVAFPVLMLAGVLRIFRPSRDRAQAELLLDVLAVSLVAMAVLWVGVLQPVLDDPTLDPLGKALLILYPSTDLLLVVAVVIGYLGRSRLAGRVSLLFIAGMAVFLVGDLVFALTNANGTYHSGQLLDLGWSVGAFLIALSALLVADRPVAVPAGRRSADVATMALVLVPVAVVFVFTRVAWEATLGVAFVDWLLSPEALEAMGEHLGVFLLLALAAGIALGRVAFLVRARSRSSLALERNAVQTAATVAAQSAFLQGGESGSVFERLLASLLTLTASDAGFLGEVVEQADGPYLRVRAITDTPWLRAAAGMADGEALADLAPRHVDRTFGQVLSDGAPLFINDPANHPLTQGVPGGVAPMSSFLALPIYHQGVLTGLAGLADRPSGYDTALVAELEPFLTTCATLIQAGRDRDQLRQREAALVERNRQLQEVDRLKDGLIAAAEDASRAKSEFLATMSHEVRTPLHGIIGSIELLRGSVHDAEGRAQLDLLAHSAERQLRLVDEILDLSRVEARQVTIQPAPMDLRALVTELMDLHRPAATAKGLALRCTIDPAIPPSVLGDHVRLSQIVSNLVGNAVKFTDAGAVDVEVVALDAAASRTASTVGIRVTDTGPGIDPAVRARIFEPFFQVDASTARRHGGAGIGLSVARRLVELMGGEIAVAGAAGGGTVFSVELPLPEADARAVAAAAVAAVPDAGSGTARTAVHQALTVLRAPAVPGIATMHTVLVVDDDPIAGQVTAGFLGRLGRTPIVVTGGEAALAALAERPVDLVLLDLQMPGMDGYTVAREQRRREAAAGADPVAIVATSADAYEEARRRCAEAGMDGHLTKPFRTPDLARVLELWAADPTSATVPGSAAAAVPEVVAAREVVPALEVAAAAGVVSASEAPEPDAGNPVLTAPLIDLFLATGSERVAGVAVAMALGDLPAAAESAHAMRGAALAFGETALADAAAAIEDHVAGRAAPDAPGPLALAQAFTAAFEATRRHLLAVRGRLPAGVDEAPVTSTPA